MSRVPPSLEDFAGRLLVHEAGGHERTEALVEAMKRVCRILYARLAPLLSTRGVNALLERAITLATREYPSLATVASIGDPDCSLEGLGHTIHALDPSEAADALVSILANFLWLLTEFIGPDLGLRKVHEAWPGVSFAPPAAP